MSLLVVLIIFAVGAILWARSQRLLRRRWLERLDLPGIWLWQGEEGELELSGDVDHGRYRLRERDREEQGEWRLTGHSLVLVPGSGHAPAALDLRMFREGMIGLHGTGRERRIYVKKRANVIPLRRPA
jgi:hypothetical protein